jgi:hypothetical protein
VFDNVFAHNQIHPVHSVSISDTYVVEQNDSNITFATPDMDPNRNKPVQDGSSYEQDRALFASLINNFKHEIDKWNNDNREAKQANVLLTKELERFKEMEKGFQNVTKRKAELEFENSNLKSQARKFEMNGESVKPLLKRNEELEVGYREAVLDKKNFQFKNWVTKWSLTAERLNFLWFQIFPPKNEYENFISQNLKITKKYNSKVTRKIWVFKILTPNFTEFFWILA